MSDHLCGTCGGNGVVNIPGGISVCDTCRGRCYAPDPELAGLRQQVASLTEKVEAAYRARDDERERCQSTYKRQAEERASLTEERDRLRADYHRLKVALRLKGD